MSEAKHTPGPWELDTTVHDGVDYGFSGVRTCSDEGYEFSRSSYTRTVAQTPHALRLDNSEVEARANMTLIAAAPDLLAALKALLPEGWGDDDTMDHMPGVKLARLAIAKAEGRA